MTRWAPLLVPLSLLIVALVLHFQSSRPNGHRDAEPQGMDAGIRFRDDAKRAGIDFVYENGRGKQMRYPETIGGGIAVLDFDRDGWPDLYLSQGTRWPPEQHRGTTFDRLFRNLGDGRFEDVTASAGIVEDGYSQGVAVGDYNSDGWPDLFVANYGTNRLYQNNGDGTFADVTELSGLTGDAWTTSAVLCDVNNDGHPDLYVVNYLGDKARLDRPCTKNSDCMPAQFRAAEDQLFLNLTDGTFRDVTIAGGLDFPNGKGLGILAARFQRQRSISLFVANDTTQNFLLTSESGSTNRLPVWKNVSAAANLATDADGRMQACMGIACDDMDNDGDLDLFVTNFADESNTLYMQTEPVRFADQTRSAGLRDASYAMLGWGTHFTDANLDGLPELVVINGHVHYQLDAGGETRMRSQMFLNQSQPGHPRFAEISPGSLGKWFNGKRFGRAAALIDWNRDGREDIAVVSLLSPFALLTNTTQKDNHFLAIELRGTDSSRDAIGTTVIVEHENGTRTRQLVGGNGFHCSNERVLIFGIGKSKRVSKITVNWPSGKTETFRDVNADQRVLILEGREKLSRLP